MSGPARTPTTALKARGSRLAKGRTGAGKAPAPATMKRAKPRPVGDLEAICRTGIPGYDPWAQAGDCTFDVKAAAAAIRFFEGELSHSKGEKARQPFLLERWQKAIIANLFGWKRPDGTRRYRESFIFVPRKNGKSPLAAGILVYMLFEDGEPGAEIYGAASEYQQAALVFQHAHGMTRQNPALAERCKVYTGQAKAVQLIDDYSTYRVVSREADSLHGANTHCYVVDEVHALPNSELIDVLETSTGARRQPLGVLITTADYDREGSPCNEKHDYAKAVRDNIIHDPAFLPVLFEAAEADDWTDPQVWAKANPNLGVSVSLDYIAAACRKAQDSPRFENTFRRLHLNQRTAQDVRWLAMDAWDSCGGAPLSLDAYRDRTCFAGLDLATTRDLTALVLCFPESDGVFTLIPQFWIPQETARERSRKDKVPYEQWIREGLIHTTPGNATDYATIRRDINDVYKKHRIIIKGIAADRLFQGEQICQELREQDGFDVVAFGQGFASMAGPTKRFEELVIARQIRHGGNPVMRWHAANVSVEIDAAGNIKPSRRKSSEKIDSIVAAIMAVARAADTKYQSAYCTRGIVWV